MDNELWEQFKLHFSELFGVDSRIPELIAANDILLLTCSGMSVKSIANKLDTDEELISSELEEYLGFNGWEVDLDINPWFVYKKSRSYDDFCSRISIVSPLTIGLELQLSFIICHKYEEIEKEINSFYERDTT